MQRSFRLSAEPMLLRRRGVLGFGAGLFGSLLAGCAVGPGTSPATGARANEGRPKLRLLCMNVWVGGRRGLATPEESIQRTLDVLRAADVDVIALQEHDGLAEFYAAELGMVATVQDRSTAVLSRWPVLGTSPTKWGVQLDTPHFGPLWVFNAHLPAAPYQPYQLSGIEYHGGRFVTSAADAITEARLARGEPALRLLRELSAALASGEPLLLAGDFNEPSHLDWTAACVDADLREHAVEWPTSRLFTEAGLIDTFRTLHADPVRRPGFTWTPRPDERDVMDRIDLVYASPHLIPIRAEVLGETGPTTDLALDPWPSDHRALRVEFARL